MLALRKVHIKAHESKVECLSMIDKIGSLTMVKLILKMTLQLQNHRLNEAMLQINMDLMESHLISEYEKVPSHNADHRTQFHLYYDYKRMNLI